MEKFNKRFPESELNLEVQIDIRDQLTRIADYLQPQIVNREEIDFDREPEHGIDEKGI